jgi:peptidyl-prolyl cis-trans isomerase A (cyclophilin A)
MNGATIGRRTLMAGAVAWLARPLQALAATAAPARPRVSLTTPKGVIVIELAMDKAPITAGNFLRYVEAKKYDGGTIYRAVRDGGKGMGTIQGGASPKARPFRPIEHESTTKTGIKHRAGTISMGRLEPGSATSDFFICASAQPYLDANPKAKGDNLGYAAFGQVVEGMSVVKAILAGRTDGKAIVPAMKGQMLNPPVPIVGAKRLA